ncbi:hypothetical protein TWF730_002304 [Orbilia blumenaviensis]|uniref:Uncharacterized protein n=1 Tax=Orbilia blumenaviensis TaxID=1796055 RepID=A0AAV9UCF4_9PEZI
MVFHRYLVLNIRFRAFVLCKKANICFNTSDLVPVIELQWQQGDAYECFRFYEARIRQLSPFGEIGITGKRVRFGNLCPKEGQTKRVSFGDKALEDSFNQIVATLTEEQLQDVEWTMKLRSAEGIYEFKRIGDQCLSWVVRTLREHNYDASDPPADPNYILFEDTDPGDPKKRLFTVRDIETSDVTVRKQIKQWVVMHRYVGKFNMADIPQPRRLWTIPKRYLRNINVRERPEEKAEEKAGKKAEETTKGETEGESEEQQEVKISKKLKIWQLEDDVQTSTNV